MPKYTLGGVAYDQENFKAVVEDYFETVPKMEQTRAGLCIYLGITKQTFMNYSKGTRGPEMQEIAEWALTNLEDKWEKDLIHKPNPTGPIFALKQYGWKDQQEVEAKFSGIEVLSNIPRPDKQ